MRVTDTILLAGAKFKAKRIRSIFTAMTAGFMLVLLLVASFFTTAILNEVRSKAPSVDTFYATEDIYNTDGSFEPPATATAEYTLRAYSSGYDLVSIDGIDAYDSGPQFDQLTLGPLSFIDAALYEDLHSGSVELGQGDVGLLVSTNFVIKKENIAFKPSDSAELRAQAIVAAQDKYRGQKVELVLRKQQAYTADFDGEVQEDETVTQQAIITGFTGGDSTLFSTFGGNYINVESLPADLGAEILARDSAETSEFGVPTTVYAFASNEDRNEFMDECSPEGFSFDRYCTYFRDPLADIEAAVDSFKGFIRFVVIFLSAVVAASMFVTISKIIGDSERETGVFRAIGATRWTVATIYLAYSVLLALVAYAGAFLLASGIGLYLTSRYGNSFGYQIAQSTASYDGASGISLVAINVPELFGVFLIGLAAALLGALFPILNVLRKDPIKAMRAD